MSISEVDNFLLSIQLPVTNALSYLAIAKVHPPHLTWLQLVQTFIQVPLGPSPQEEQYQTTVPPPPLEYLVGVYDAATTGVEVSSGSFPKPLERFSTSQVSLVCSSDPHCVQDILLGEPDVASASFIGGWADAISSA
jgi:hypothetical protein